MEICKDYNKEGIMNTVELNALRGELAHDILNIEDVELLKKIKRSVNRLVSHKQKTETFYMPKTKAEIIADLEEVREQMDLARAGKIKGESLQEFLNELHH